MTNDEMVGWHHQHNGHEFEQTPGDSEGRGSLVCCSLWGCRVRHNLVTGQQREFKKFDSDSSGILIIASVQEQILGTPYLPFEPQGKPYDKPRQCIKSRDITLLTKSQIVKAMVFPVIMYGCESCTIKKVE